MPPLPRPDPHADVLVTTLREKFKKNAFRPLQKEIIEAALEGNDIFVQAATSFGKSICFQLPATIERGVTLVISPLLSLMMDQVEALRELGIAAGSLNSNTSQSDRSHILRDLQGGNPTIKLLYVTPELCAGHHFRRRLQTLDAHGMLARVAIDEAHCISEWGHDFRKDFLALSWLRDAFPDVPIICLTATASPRVRDDVLGVLGLRPERLRSFVTTAHRTNLHLAVRYVDPEHDNRLEDFVAWAGRVRARREREPRRSELGPERVENVPGIIYTLTRNECESLAAALRAEGLGAHVFHAGLPADKRADTLARWKRNEPDFDVVVATTAFGMGIDKENVRFVVHWRLPKSFEGFYQEVGRCGRDADAGVTFVYYCRDDAARMLRLVRKDSAGENLESREKSLEALVRYCEDTSECRNVQICRYFGEQQDRLECNRACDRCKDPGDPERRKREALGTDPGEYSQ